MSLSLQSLTFGFSCGKTQLYDSRHVQKGHVTVLLGIAITYTPVLLEASAREPRRVHKVTRIRLGLPSGPKSRTHCLCCPPGPATRPWNPAIGQLRSLKVLSEILDRLTTIIRPQGLVGFGGLVSRLQLPCTFQGLLEVAQGPCFACKLLALRRQPVALYRGQWNRPT